MSAPGIETQLALINQKLDLLVEQRTDHETRLRSLEQARWKFAGIAAALGAVTGYVAPLLTR
jgi:hypothetical protein